AVTKEAERHAIFVPVLDRKSQSDRQRNVCGDNGVATVHMALLVEKMHRAAQSTRAAGRFSEELRHARVRAGATRKRMSMIPVSGNDVVIVAHGRHRTGHDCFLANVKMAKTADLLRLILLARAFLKTPDQQHQREHLDFVALLHRLHGGHPAAAGRNRAARAPDLSLLCPTFMHTTKTNVNRRSLTSEFRKNIQLGVALYWGNPTVSDWTSPAKFFA